MRIRNQDSSGSLDHEVNMTPLIDVSLVLVVMLLLATPLAFESSIAVRKSVDTSQAAPIPDPGERIEVRLIDEETVRLNAKTIPRESLREAMVPLLGNSLPRRVMVGCEDGVTHGAFVDVLDQVKRAGARDISVMGSGR
jgi:biopolymer transport protein TolR